MKTKIVTALIMGIGTIAFGQGSLTPPGFPAPTMKTLTELDAAIGSMSNAVEQIQDDPRTPLVAGSPGVAIYTSGTIVINQSGSYYLTKNLTVTSGDGIRISAAGVTVDLQGFTIRSTSATPADEGIDIDSGHVSIFNGHIESGTVYDSGASGDQYSGPGFNYGIYAILSTSSGIHIRDISVSGCDSSGIYIASDDSIVESCIVKVVGGRGIQSGMVNNCSATTCGGTAIYGIQIENCKGTSTGDDGIVSSGTVANSYGETTGTSPADDGIYAQRSVQNSYGSSAGGHGIRSRGMVANSNGITDGASLYSDGIEASKSVQNSYGHASSVAGGDGIQAKIVSDSYGTSNGTNASVYGIQATIATSCYAIGGENITHKYNMP